MEEECKQLQRTQQPKQPCPQPALQNDSDNEEEALVQDPFSLEEIEEEEFLHEELAGPPVQRLPLPPTAPSCSRNSQEGCHQKSQPKSPPTRGSSKYLREPGLTMQPSKQAQIVKTNQHLNSFQTGGRAGTSAKTQALQYLPPSPVPSRHLPSLSNSKSQHLDGENTLSANVTAGNSSALFSERLTASPFSYLQHGDKGSSHPFMSKSKTHERLAVHTPPTMEKSSQGISETRQQNSICPSPVSTGMVVSSSTSSLSSSSSFSESIKGHSPDFRLKENTTNQGQSGTAELRPRNTPFMGIMDKTVRFQQQQQQQQHMTAPNRSWHGQTTEGFLKSTAAAGGTSLSSEQFSAKQSGNHGNQAATFSSSSSSLVKPGESIQNGTQSKELEDLKCQASACSQDSRMAKSVSHLYQEVLSKQHSQLNKDTHASHVNVTKPKRSFVESNV